MRAVLVPSPERLEVALGCRRRQALDGGRPCVQFGERAARDADYALVLLGWC